MKLQNKILLAIASCVITLAACTESHYDTSYVPSLTSYVPSLNAVHSYVDLGLSVKWATCNVGADNPGDYGDYFAWGETTGYNSGKTNFDWSTYKWCNGSYNNQIKYCTNSSYGIVDNKTVLEASDDAATANWGSGWRMPTQAEWQELIDNSTWAWTQLNSVNGYKVTSKKSGYTDKSIFLPAAGYRNDVYLLNAGSYGYYWSSSLYADIISYAWYVRFFSDSHRMDYYYRCCGQSVRAVFCQSDTIRVTDIKLSSSSVKIETNKTLQLTVTVFPSNATNKVIKWTSSNTSVATVSSSGLISAVTSGTATITAVATDGSGVSATCTVIVKSDEYVDLGLSVKWATCNVGADNPEDYGDYFAWGETTGYNSGKTTFDWSNYKWCNGSYDTMTKYCTQSSYGNEGFTDDKTVLEAEDDAATANWGSDWRMPTIAEWQELIDNCIWTWTQLNGVNGYKVTSKKSGYTDKSIFLPAAGCRYGTNLYNAGSHGFYWSSSLSTGSGYYAWRVSFDSDDHGMSYGSRDYGRSVRAVRAE